MDNQNLGFAGKLAKIFVLNSRLTLLLILTLFAWGVFSFIITPKQYNPEIIAPAFQITTEFPGATEKETRLLVTKPLENIIKTIDGVDETMSVSIDGAVSIITVKFFVGESLEDSKIKLTQKIAGNLNTTPNGSLTPIIRELTPDDVPIVTLAISSESYSSAVLRKLTLDIRDELISVPGTSGMEIHGGRKMQAKIIINPQELNAKNISILQLADTLKKNNLKYPSGDLEIGKKSIAVEVNGAINNIQQLGNIVLSTEENNPVYLKDIAQITYAPEETEDLVKFREAHKQEKNTVFLSIAKKKGTNITTVSNALLKKIEELQKKNFIPNSVDIQTVRNEGKTANEEINGLVKNLIQAIVIVSFILMLFLGFRASLVVAIAIPLTLLSVFGIGLLAGQTINRITLFALILSLGLLVDNATVVVENAVRHIKNKTHKKSIQTAVIEAVDEVGMGLLMSTITTLFAFFPMAFVTGMMGPYMGPIPFFVPAALIVSLIIAFTINPYLSATFISVEEKPLKNRYLEEKKRIIIQKFSSYMESYKKFLHKIFLDHKLRKKILTFTLIAFFFSIMLPAIGIVKFRMLPKADREQFYVYLDYPVGTLIEENIRITNKIEDFLLKNPEILSIQSFIGTPPVVDFNGLFKGSSQRSQPNTTTIKVNLTHHNDRKLKSEEIVLELRPKLYELLQSEPDTKIKLIEDPPGPPVLSTVLLKIKGENSQTLDFVSRDIEEILKQTDEVVDIDNSRTENSPKITLSIDHDRAARSGLDTQRAAAALNIALNGSPVSIFHNNNNKEQEFIFMRMSKDHRDQIEDLNSIYLSNNTGQKVPLSQIVRQKKEPIPEVIYHDNRQKTVYLSAEMGDRSVTYAVIDIFKQLIKYSMQGNLEITDWSLFGVNYLDKNTGEVISVEWGGEWELTLEVFRDLGAAMMVAIFLVYVVLVAQFHSFKTPLLIMGTIPLALIGVLPGFAILGYLNGLYFNATSMIGVIALAGIVVNNAIIFMEYLNGLRTEGLTAEEALIEAGATRTRPIVLTSLTTILGSFTIIGDPVWSGLAWSIIFGISISTLLTLIIFPILYYTFEGKSWNCDRQGTCESHGPTLK